MRLNALIDKSAENYITFRNYFSKGFGMFYEFMRFGNLAVSVTALLLMISIKYNVDTSIPVWMTITSLILAIAFFTWLGWWWDKRKYWHMESEWANQRNPLTKDIREGLKHGK